MILAQADHETSGDAWFDAGRAIGFDHEVRWARHPRLIEAHEQLVLGPQTCWIGDCMRRDPMKCDAFESYVEGCGEAAGCALVSLERLWIACEPLLARGLRSRRPSPRPVRPRGAGQAGRRVGDDCRHAPLSYHSVTEASCKHCPCSARTDSLFGQRLGKSGKCRQALATGENKDGFRLLFSHRSLIHSPAGRAMRPLQANFPPSG